MILFASRTKVPISNCNDDLSFSANRRERWKQSDGNERFLLWHENTCIRISTYVAITKFEYQYLSESFVQTNTIGSWFLLDPKPLRSLIRRSCEAFIKLRADYWETDNWKDRNIDHPEKAYIVFDHFSSIRFIDPFPSTFQLLLFIRKELKKNLSSGIYL